MEGAVALMVKHRKAALRNSVAAAIVVLISGIAYARQSTARALDGTTGARPYKYEVVSIKPNKSEFGTDRADGITSARDEFVAKNVRLSILVDIAYGIRHNEQLSGGPDWVYSDKDKYDLDAKMDEATAEEIQKLSRDERTAIRQQMLQEVLATRFNLKVHHEDRDLRVYFLEIAKSGLKLKEVKADDPNNTIKRPDGGLMTDIADWTRGESGTVIMTAHAVSTNALMRYLEQYAGRILIDRTQLTGHYDFTLQFLPALPVPDVGGSFASSGPDPAAPSLLTAIEEQLGLKLEPGRAPSDVVVIDHVERPSGN